MSPLVVVDTSVFVEYLRGTADDALAVLILQNQVLLSPLVKLELLAGVRKSEFKIIEKLCNALIPINELPSLKDCEKLLHRARGTGLLGGIVDLLIISDVIKSNAILFSYDQKMCALAVKLGVRILKG